MLEKREIYAKVRMARPVSWAGHRAKHGSEMKGNVQPPDMLSATSPAHVLPAPNSPMATG